MAQLSEQASPRTDRRINIAVCVFLTALIWIVFGQTLGHDFINYDDPQYVTENSHISAGLTREGLVWFLTHSHAALWHPLTTLSHMLDCQIYGLKPAGHHFTNVLLHNIGTVLVFLVLRGITGRVWRSAFVAAIFAIHPMRVESVAWVAERKDVLSGIFFMLTIWTYARYARAPNFWRYVTMSIFLACGLMSKATFVPVPLLLLLLDYWPLQRAETFRDLRPLIVEKIPLLALSAAASVATIFAQTVTMATLDQIPLLWRLKNAIVSIAIYLRQMFWPTDLGIFYPHPHDQLNIWAVLSAAALIIAITLFAITVRQKHPYVLAGWFWFLILVAPVLGIFQTGLQARADRFTYLPHIGITIAIAWLIADLTQGWRNRKIVLGSVASCVVAASTIVAWKQTTYWRDSVSIWERTIAVTSDNQIAQQDLAAALQARGDVADARKHSRLAAIIHAQTILKDFPLDVPSHNDLGVLLIQTGDIHGGIQQWEISLEIDPDDGNALNNLAWVLATFPDASIRNGKRAVELAERATALPGGNAPIILRTLAAAHAETGDFSKAIETAQRAIDSATLQRNTSLVATLQHEIELYRASTPYREAPPE
jgi:tetratricopeptide (TPR) repeat protein